MLNRYQVELQYYDANGVIYNRIETVRAYTERHAIQKVLLKYDVIKIINNERV